MISYDTRTHFGTQHVYDSISMCIYTYNYICIVYVCVAYRILYVQLSVRFCVHVCDARACLSKASIYLHV